MKKFLAVLFFILTTILIGAEKENEKIITVAQGSKPKSLDPHTYNEFPTLGITEHIFNTLVTFNDEGIVVPELASEFEYLSSKEILFTIRDNVKFHNGAILTADDVVFSLERMKERPGSRVLIDDIEKIEKVGNNQVLITLKEPTVTFLGKLTLPIAAIMNKEYVLAGNNLATKPMGTGPYMISNWDTFEIIELKSFNDYFKGTPKNDGITFKIITEDSSRLMALEAGDVDVIYAVAPVDFSLVERHSKLDLFIKETVTTDYIGLNVKKKGLDNENIRKAIHMAVDKEGMLYAVFMGKGRVAESPINPSIFGSFQEFDRKQNIEEAKKIVEEYEKKNGQLSFKIWTSENNLRTQMAQILQANLKDIGIDSQIEIVEWGTFLKKTSEGEHDILLSTWILGVSDIDTIVTTLFMTDSIGMEGNRSFYSNEDLDKKIIEARRISDLEERRKAYEEIQKIIFRDNPVIPLIYRVDGVGINKRIKNFQYNKASMRNIYEEMEIVE